MHLPIWLLLTLPGLVMWLVILLLPWRPWHTQPRLEADASASGESLADMTVLIPARNEADQMATTLQAVLNQGPDLHVVVIDDNSTDDTTAITRTYPVHVVSAPPAPLGWSGKLWALEQGLAVVDTPLTLLLDADIELSPGILSRLQRHLYDRQLTLASLFVTLGMDSAWEKLLLPPFGYFFRLLYPFRLGNNHDKRTAVAAGGCILVETAALRTTGGFASYHDALIDDCELARRIKADGGRTWIGLTRSAHSRRAYPALAPIWNMVARCAYTQLHYSALLLGLCTVLMLLAFIAPVTGLFAPAMSIKTISAGTLLAMLASYLPTLRYYQRNPAWVLTLPLAGLLYLAMTWSSALRYWRGTRSRWKGRDYWA